MCTMTGVSSTGGDHTGNGCTLYGRRTQLVLRLCVRDRSCWPQQISYMDCGSSAMPALKFISEQCTETEVIKLSKCKKTIDQQFSNARRLPHLVVVQRRY